jgi:PfaD family protein
MFAPRARKLYQVYRTYQSLDAIPRETLDDLEKNVFGASIADAWAATREFWMERDPTQLARAEADPRHKMALTFRSYLGLSSRWSIAGRHDRRFDYQIWCGPAMGAFNAWTAGSFLAQPEHRTVIQVANNLMEGAAVLTRAHQFRTLGVAVPPDAFNYRPRALR